MEQNLFDFCASCYNEAYIDIKKQLTDEAISHSKPKKLSDTKYKEIDMSAQLLAIKKAMIDGRKQYPNKVPELWESIYKAHLYRKTGIKDPKIVEEAIKAAQSWKSSSGHAFEEMVKELATLAMKGTEIKFILQRDLNVLLKAKELANTPTDIAWLEKQVSGSVFDVYAVAEVPIVDEEDKVSHKLVCFGCVQCKTSIRDRVSRDVVPSKEAMESKFWSIAFVLDGRMLRIPKYKNMVNGNLDSEFKRNGWHGVYVLSQNENEDRIYGVDLDFHIVRSHTIRAFQQWYKDRMGLTINWRADE